MGEGFSLSALNLGDFNIGDIGGGGGSGGFYSTGMSISNSIFTPEVMAGLDELVKTITDKVLAEFSSQFGEGGIEGFSSSIMDDFNLQAMPIV